MSRVPLISAATFRPDIQTQNCHKYCIARRDRDKLGGQTGLELFEHIVLLKFSINDK